MASVQRDIPDMKEEIKDPIVEWFKALSFTKKALVIAVFISVIVIWSVLMINTQPRVSRVVHTSNPKMVAAQLIEVMRNDLECGTLSNQLVQFIQGQSLSVESIEKITGINPYRIHFCHNNTTTDQRCKYPFDPRYFYASDRKLTVKKAISGYIWVYNSDGQFYIGFKREETSGY